MLRKVRLALAAPLAFGVKVTVKEADCPAVRVFGKVIPESTNSLLSLLPDVTVTEAPVAFRVPLSAEFPPTTTSPKFNVAGVTDSCPCAVPVPESATFRGELDASETIARLPLTAPVAAGVKLAVKVTLWPDVRVAGKVSPVLEKPEPVTFACEIVTVVPPVLVSVSDRLALPPTCTLPNERLAGLGESVPGVTPVPVSAIFSVGLAPLDVMVTLPLAAPPAAGANCTLNVVLWPALRVNGSVNPLML